MAYEALQADPPGEPDANTVLAEFRAFLRTVTPRLWLVPAIVAANVALFGIMVASGVDAFAPGADRVLAWGANYGPATLRGAPWRLLASTFLHFGVVHLAMNMVALWDAGRFVERIFGHARFATIYLAAGLCGSAASLLAHPQSVSAGASGAVFGVYGALGGFLLRQRSAIPPKVLSRLGGVAAAFIGYNTLYAFTRANVDVAAHVGGALAGAIAGAYLARPLAPARKEPGRDVAIAAVGCVAAVAIAWGLVPGAGDLPLSTRQLPGFSLELPGGEVVEEDSGYQTGRLMMKVEDGTRTFLTVGWEPGRASREDLELTGDAVATKYAATRRSLRLAGPGGASVDGVVLDSDQLTIQISMVDCGRRRITLAVGGAPDVEALHRRILPTLACRPDPRLETDALGAVPVILDLPGWTATDRTDGQVVLSDGRSMLLLKSGVVSSKAGLGEVLAATFGAIFRETRELAVTPTGPDSASLTGTIDGNHVEGWARQIRCPAGGIMLMAFAPDAGTADQVRALTSSARCAQPGEAPQRWPDAPKPPGP